VQESSLRFWRAPVADAALRASSAIKVITSQNSARER
jgi:hypothetical protein